MKFSNLIIIGALFGAISVDAIKISALHDDEEADPDADAKQPKKIDMKTLDGELDQAAADEKV